MISQKKRLITTLIRIIIGSVFIIGAILKLYPIEPLEILLVKLNISNWFLSSFFARFIICFELILGILLVFNISLKKTLYLSAITLVGFTLFLLYFRFIFGSNDNCGCFGSIIQMKPIESIIKNIVLLALIVFLIIKSDYRYWTWKKIKPFLTVFIIIAGTATPFILNTVNIYDDEGFYVIKPGMRVEGKDLENINFNNKQINLLEGRKLLCFYSVECPVCKYSASKLSVIQRKSKNTLSIYIIFLDNKNKDTLLPEFLKETDVNNIPYTIFDAKRFYKISDKDIPFLMYLENGEIINLSNYRDMDPDYVIKFLTEQ